MRHIIIESLGVYLPEREVSTQEVIQSCREVIRYPLGRLTGIVSRRVAGEKEYSIDLARKAISRCLERSQYHPKDIDLVICCNISRYDYEGRVSYEPSTAARMKSEFGFQWALCFDISNACAGMFTAIHVVDSFIKSGLAKRGLVVSGEYITHLTKTAQREILDDKDDPRLACLTLGDSGAAILLKEAEAEGVGLQNIEMFTLGKYSDLCIARPSYSHYGGCIMKTDSTNLLQVALMESSKLIAGKLKNLWKILEINHFLMHQIARPAIDLTVQKINQIAGKVLIKPDQVINNLEFRGNTSSTTHFVALWDKIHSGEIQSRDVVLFAVQASGVTLGSASYTFDDLPDRMRAFSNSYKKNGRARIHGPVKVPDRSDVNGNEKARGNVFSQGARRAGVRVGIRAIGTALHSGQAIADSIALASRAVKDCLGEAGCPGSSVDLLVNVGVHRNDFIGEPAIASIIAGENELNATVNDWAAAKTFAFDLCNGATGFLQGCRVIQAMIGSGKASKALCVSSEIENNKLYFPEGVIGLQEAGCAALLEESEDGGFLEFLFSHYPELQDAFHSELRVESFPPYLKVWVDSNLESYILSRLKNSIEKLLHRAGLTMRHIKVIVPPQISSDFVYKFSEILRPTNTQVVNLKSERNFYSCSSIFGLKYILDNKMVNQGDLGIFLEAGSGLQIASALYQF